MVATVATGSGMAKKPNELGPTKTQHGLSTWADRLLPGWRLWIMKQWYGNERAAVDRLREVRTEREFVQQNFPIGYQNFNVANFSVRAFLVRSRCYHTMSIRSLQAIEPH